MIPQRNISLISNTLQSAGGRRGGQVLSRSIAGRGNVDLFKVCFRVGDEFRHGLAWIQRSDGPTNFQAPSVRRGPALATAQPQKTVGQSSAFEEDVERFRLIYPESKLIAKYSDQEPNFADLSLVCLT